VVNSLSCSKRVDHQALLAVAIQTPHWYPSLQWHHNECSILYEPNTLWMPKTASGHIQRDCDESSDQLQCVLHCCMCTSHGGIFRSQNAQKKLSGSRVYALQRGYHPDVDLLGQWRNSYHDITTKTCCVKHTWSPTSQWYLQASPPGACLHDKLQSCGGSTMNACVQCMNFINNIVHRILPHYQLMASCQNVSSVVHWLQDIRLMLPSEVSHSSDKLTPWNPNLFAHFTVRSDGSVA